MQIIAFCYLVEGRVCDDEDRGVGADVVRRAAADDGRTADDGTLKRSAEHNPQPAHTQRQDEAAATSAGP